MACALATTAPGVSSDPLQNYGHRRRHHHRKHKRAHVAHYVLIVAKVESTQVGIISMVPSYIIYNYKYKLTSSTHNCQHVVAVISQPTLSEYILRQTHVSDFQPEETVSKKISSLNTS